MDRYALGDELVGVLADGAVDEGEQARYLGLGPAPVLAAEDIQAQDLDPAVGRVADDGHDGVNALDVAGDPRQTARPRPSGGCHP